MRFTSKAELIARIEKEHRAFVDLAASVPPARWRERGVWGDGWSLLDLHAHLIAWEQMCLRWHREKAPALPAPGYTWRESPKLNRAIQRKHAGRPAKRLLAEFDASYREILALARRLTPRELFERGRFPWTGKNAFVTYLSANTCSHYHTASRYVKRWRGRSRDRITRRRLSVVP